MEVPSFFTFEKRVWQCVGSSGRRGAFTYSDGAQRFIDAAPGIIESTGPVFTLARLLIESREPVLAKISCDHYGDYVPATSGLVLLAPEKHPKTGRLVSRLFRPIAAPGRAEGWDS